MDLWAFNDKWVVSDYFNTIDRKPDKSLTGKSVHYQTNPDMINKTALDLQTASDFSIRWMVVFPHKFDITAPIQIKNVRILKKQFSQKWNVCHYLLLNAAPFHPIQVDKRLSQMSLFLILFELEHKKEPIKNIKPQGFCLPFVCACLCFLYLS